MRDISTEDLVRTFAISIERRVRAEDILLLDRSAKNAAQVKARQRDERNALKALNKHLRDCIHLVEQGLMTMNEARKKAGQKKPVPGKEHLYRPTRRGLKRVKGS